MFIYDVGVLPRAQHLPVGHILHSQSNNASAQRGRNARLLIRHGPVGPQLPQAHYQIGTMARQPNRVIVGGKWKLALATA